MSDTEHDDIYGQLRMTGVNEHETIDSIHLLNQLENGSWTTIETFRLTGAEWSLFYVKKVETTQELQAAYLVREKVFVEEQGVPLHLELDEHDATAIHFIVYDNEKVIAASRIREIDAGIGKIERVCVLKDYRGKKLGMLIMKEVEKHASEKGLKKLKLHAQSYSVPFYEKLNYIVTSPEFMDADIPHRVMEKDI